MNEEQVAFDVCASSSCFWLLISDILLIGSLERKEFGLSAEEFLILASTL